ncbi:hypothetical protein GcM3_018029 [Golovinomyces cichoracearum]|uniref:Uncharacterized protein n=1 Tax=Golovinomyces cichoracearum TaxID=62708 RepID=A0A420J865_9PEZI|nr:hypothetical protein GcM3_018029 [Golovinomyces cichoracearum]
MAIMQLVAEKELPMVHPNATSVEIRRDKAIKYNAGESWHQEWMRENGIDNNPEAEELSEIENDANSHYVGKSASKLKVWQTKRGGFD